MRKYVSFLLVLILLCACTPQPEKGHAVKTIYHTTADALLAPQEVTIDVMEPKAEIVQLFSILNEIQLSEFCDGVELESFSLVGDTLALQLSLEYEALSGLSRTVCDGAITLTFCDLPYVNTMILRTNGTEKSLTRDDFLLSLPAHSSQAEVKLYFNKDGVLSEEVHTYPYQIEDEFLRTVAEALLAGPQSEALVSPIPSGTRLHAISKEGGVCTVDVSAEFLALPSHTEEEERLCLFSLVNTVAHASDARQVRILIDGESVTGFTHYDLTQAIQPELFD